MKREPRLTHEERIAIVRRRLNEETVTLPLNSAAIKNFALDAMDVLDGRIGTLTKDERERVKSWRRL